MSIWRVHMHFTYIQRRTPTLNILFWQNAHSSQNSKPESHAELSREFGVVELGWLVRQSHMLKLFAVWIPKSCHSLWNSCKSQMPCRITTFQFYLLNVPLAPVSPPLPSRRATFLSAWTWSPWTTACFPDLWFPSAHWMRLTSFPYILSHITLLWLQAFPSSSQGHLRTAFLMSWIASSLPPHFQLSALSPLAF